MLDAEKAIYETLLLMEQDREKARRFPPIIFLSELYRRVDCGKDTFNNAVNALCAAQKAKMGECINERYIRALRGEK